MTAGLGGMSVEHPGSASVSIGLPVYNGLPFLERTLASLLAQDHAPLELVISDNGSTDGTEAVCRRWAEQDERIVYLRAPVNQGAAWNYNRVLEVAGGDLFKWAAADDVCAPTFVSACVAALAAGPASAVLAYPQTVLIDSDDHLGLELDDSDLDLRQKDPAARLRQLLHHRFEWHPVFGVIRADALRRTDGIGSFLSADIALLAELALQGEFLQVPDRLFLRRYHDGRSVVANPTWREQMQWYDPSHPRKVVLPQARLVRALLAGVARSDLPPTERLACSWVVATAWALPHWRHIGGEVKQAARQWFAPRG